jgi:predicted small lipoprotein YifL
VGLILFRETHLVRLAAVGLLAAALGLSACGRKGPLDPPPGAAVQKREAPAAELAGAPKATVVDSRGRAVELKRKTGRGPVAAAPTGQQPDFFLDWLLD